MTEFQERLFALQDLGYRDFTAPLIPGVELERIIGVRTPAVRKLAAELIREGKAEAFLEELPHRYLEENGLHVHGAWNRWNASRPLSTTGRPATA